MITVDQAEATKQSHAQQLMADQAARAQANRFILENLRDGFCAGVARLVVIGQEPVWSVPIVYTPTNQTPSQIGEILVHAVRGDVVGFTPPSEIYRHARQLIS